MPNFAESPGNKSIPNNFEFGGSGNTDTRTHGGALGRSQQRTVIVRTDREQASNLTSPVCEPHSIVSCMMQSLVSLRKRSAQAINSFNRLLQVTRSIGFAGYYRTPAAIQHVLQQGGVFGKIAQVLALDINRQPHILPMSGSEDERNRLCQEIGNALSQYRPSQIPPDDVINKLQDNIAGNGNIQHIRTLGRGTICQVDHVVIDDADYAVKSLSPALSKAIKSDVAIASTIIFPLMKFGGMISDADISTWSDACKTFYDETDLSLELNNTRRQKEIFNKLSTSGNYSVSVTSSDGDCQVPVIFKVPQVYPDVSSSDALVMELVEGCSLDRKSEIRNMLQLWAPAWNNHQVLNDDQIDQLIKGLKEQILTVYLDAAKQSQFINVDFHSGNMMLTLEGGGITVYFIDHGNCIKLDNLTGVATHYIHYCLVHSLFKFFHSRVHGSSAEFSGDDGVSATKIPRQEGSGILSYSYEDNYPSGCVQRVCSPSPDPYLIKDLTLIPMTDSALDYVNSEIKDLVSAFGPDARPSDDLIKWCQEERSVAEICEKLYDWVRTEWVVWSANAEIILSKDKFVSFLPTLLFKAAFESKDLRDLSHFEKTRRSGIKFDDYVHGLGLGCPCTGLMLFARVAKQINCFKIE